MGGNLETAFALPAIHSSQFAPPSDSVDGSVTEYPDGGWFEYEPATGRWHARGIKSMVIEAADNITLKTGEFVVEADTRGHRVSEGRQSAFYPPGAGQNIEWQAAAGYYY